MKLRSAAGHIAKLGASLIMVIMVIMVSAAAIALIGQTAPPTPPSTPPTPPTPSLSPSMPSSPTAPIAPPAAKPQVETPAQSPPADAPTPAKPQAATGGKVIVIENVQEAAMGQPRVHVRLMQDNRIVLGRPRIKELGGEPEKSFIAYLDTGASGYVMCNATADRFGIRAVKDSAYIEVGLHGEMKLGVSPPYSLSLGSASGAVMEDAPEKFMRIQKDAAWLVHQNNPQGLMALVGEVNVIGMPAIKRMIVEFDPAPMRERAGDPNNHGGILILGQGPAVKIHNIGAKFNDDDAIIVLESIDFNQRKHPDNRGPLPTLASNPMILGIKTENGAGGFSGDWLLDTGAAASIISIKQAKALGLYKDDGTPTRTSDFSLPLGGLGGEDNNGGAVKQANGFYVDRMFVKARDNVVLEYRRVPVVVKDVGIKGIDGRDITLDGVFGMNLLLPSASGLETGMPNKTSDGPFDRVYIDGVRSVLGLKKR